MTQYLYDGLNPVEEMDGATPPNPTATMLTGLDIDEYFQRVDSNGALSYLTDMLGSTVALADSSGALETTYTYDPFGNVTVNGADTNPYQFTGRENDDTGLYYYRARYYSPTLQRFIAQDPLGVAGGGPTLYGYAANDPIDFFDPLGLATTGNGVIVGGAVGGAGATFDVQIVHDTQGNYGVAVTVCGGGITQPLGVSLGGIHSSGNANTISDLQGASLDVGTEVSSENPLLPLGPMGGGSLTLGTDASGNSTATKNVCVGGSAGISPLEMSGMACKTWVFP
jgi:RHS repeat-associated protein